MILSAKLQRNTSLAITSGSKSFELRVQLYGSPPHGKSSIKISTIVCKYDIDISNFIHSKETSFGSRWRMPQPRAEAVFKKGDTVTTTSVHIHMFSWSPEISSWSRSQQLLPAARFVSRYPLSPNLDIASTPSSPRTQKSASEKS